MSGCCQASSGAAAVHMVMDVAGVTPSIASGVARDAPAEPANPKTMPPSVSVATAAPATARARMGREWLMLPPPLLQPVWTSVGTALWTTVRLPQSCGSEKRLTDDR